MSAPEWRGIVVKKYRALLDGSNLYRRILVRLDDGETVKTRVDRGTWKALAVGDTVVRTAGTECRRPNSRHSIGPPMSGDQQQ